VDAVHLPDLPVVRLQIGVAEGPGWRDPVLVLDLGEILLAEPRQARAVHLRAAAHDVVDAGREAAAGAVEPPLRRLVAPVDEHRARRPVLRLARQALPALQHEDVDAPARQRVRRRAPAHTGPDDHDVRVQRPHSAIQAHALIEAGARLEPF